MGEEVPVTAGACGLCGSSLAEPWLAVKHPGLVRCSGCGLVTWKTIAPPEELERLYNEQVFSPMEYYALSVEADLRTFREVFVLIRKRTQPGRALDVGCSSGAFLQAAQDEGWRGEGIDLNRRAVEFCVQRGVKASYGVLGPGAFPPDTFDLVHMGDVIEHVTDPVGLLRLAREALKPGGLVVISTPNIDSWAARKFQIKPVEHLFYFDRRTLALALEKAGFRGVEVGVHDRYRSLAGLSESSTFKDSPLARSALRWTRKVVPASFSFRLPAGENLLAFARNGRSDG